MKEQQQESKWIWPYPVAACFVVLTGDVLRGQRGGKVGAGLEQIARGGLGPSGSAEQRACSFITVRGLGVEGRRSYWTIPAHCLTDSWRRLIQHPWRLLTRSLRRKETCCCMLRGFARAGYHLSVRCTELFVKSGCSGVRGIQWASSMITKLTIGRENTSVGRMPNCIHRTGTLRNAGHLNVAELTSADAGKNVGSFASPVWEGRTQCEPGKPGSPVSLWGTAFLKTMLKAMISVLNSHLKSLKYGLGSVGNMDLRIKENHFGLQPRCQRNYFQHCYSQGHHVYQTDIKILILKRILF